MVRAGTSVSYPSLRPLALIWAVIVIIFGIICAIDYRYASECEYNPYQRGYNPDDWGTSPIPSFVVLGYILTLIFSQRGFGAASHVIPYSAAATLTVHSVLYFPVIGFLEWWKLQLDDWECHSKHSNAISGHSFFVVWTIATIWFYNSIIQQLYTRPPYVRGLCEIGFYLVTIFCCLQMCFTYAYGYHTLQQMVIGYSLGTAYEGLCLCVTPRVSAMCQRYFSKFDK